MSVLLFLQEMLKVSCAIVPRNIIAHLLVRALYSLFTPQSLFLFSPHNLQLTWQDNLSETRGDRGSKTCKVVWTQDKQASLPKTYSYVRCCYAGQFSVKENNWKEE